LRILYVTAADLSRDGGDIEHVLGISENLAALGHVVHLVARGERWVPSTDSLRISVARGRSSLLAELNALGRLAMKTGGSFCPDVIYLRSFPLDYPLVVRRLSRLRCPIVVELNTLLADEYIAKGEPLRGKVFGRFERLTLRHSDGWIGVTDEILDAASRSAKEERPSHVGLNGFDADHVSTSRSRDHARLEIGIDHNGPALLLAGFSRPWHGVDRAVALLASLPDAVELWLVGAERAAERASVEGLAVNYGVSGRVRIWDWVMPAEMSTIVQAADLGLGPLALDRTGMSQAQPIKVRTYLALGLPVLMNYCDPMLPSSLPFVTSCPSTDPVALAVPALRMLSLGQPTREEIRTFALESLTWRQAATETVEFLGQRVAGDPDRARSDVPPDP
jgi:glycosyltransferase involved in cell wall biosynthesis